VSELDVRDVRPEDAPELAELLNAIIARGGTTAFQTPFTPQQLADEYLIGAHMVSAVVASDRETGRAEGFQILGDFGDALAEGCGDIGTYVRIDGKQRGVGTALFAATCANARAKGLTMLNATIRGDNEGGLTFYRKMGFVDHAVRRGIPLADGTLADRVYKRFSLRNNDAQN